MRIEEKSGNLVIVDFNEMEAYKIASKIESDGIDFYGSLSGNTDNPKVKQTLQLLLNEENKHLKFFQEQLFAIRGKTIDGFEEDDLLQVIDYKIFMPIDSKKMKEILKDSKKALQFAIAIEDKSIKFYESCNQQVAAAQAKSEIANIVEEEKKHKKLLQGLLEN
jgi:rubrerythrin